MTADSGCLGSPRETTYRVTIEENKDISLVIADSGHPSSNRETAQRLRGNRSGKRAPDCQRGDKLHGLYSVN